MPLNTATGNMYEFITHTWNTVKGECPHGCIYCYMKRWGKQKPAHFDSKELKTDLGHGNYIFVGSSCDLFADAIPNKWIIETLGHCDNFKNKYLFQSKSPGNMITWAPIMPSNSVICTTIETNRWYNNIMGDTPTPCERASALMRTLMPKYLTIEPIMDFDLIAFVDIIKRCEPTQVNIGADSGRNNLPEPPAAKILNLLDELQKFTTIARKTNLGRLLKS
jgi:hypothetical protein